MSRANNQWRRGLGYIGGWLLFFGPVALWPRIYNWFSEGAVSSTMHSVCLRIPLLHSWEPAYWQAAELAMLSLLVLVVTAYYGGPLFCGRLCPAGAVGEYLSKLLPARWQIEWAKHCEVLPLRYGFFAGYVLSPHFGGSLACAYCNYAWLERLSDASAGGWSAVGSTAWLTIVVWLGLFGILTVGGRGFCRFLCPVGVIQSLAYALGWRSGNSVVIQWQSTRCSYCTQCVRQCPMRAVRQSGEEISIERQLCIVCQQCVTMCPRQALRYTRDSQEQTTRRQAG